MTKFESYVCGVVIGTVGTFIGAAYLGVKHGEKMWRKGFDTAHKMHELIDICQKYLKENESK